MYVYISLTLSLCVYHICVYRIKFMFVVPLNVSFKCVSSSLRRTYHQFNETEQKSCKTSNRIPQTKISYISLEIVNITSISFFPIKVHYILQI